MDGRLEYEAAIHIAQLEKKLADAQEQYRDILSEYNTLRQNHSRAMDRMHEVEAERNALADWANEVADVVRDKRFGSSHVELALWLGRQARKAPTSILMRLSREKAEGADE